MYEMNYSHYKIILRSDPTYMFSQMVQIQYFSSLSYTPYYVIPCVFCGLDVSGIC